MKYSRFGEEDHKLSFECIKFEKFLGDLSWGVECSEQLVLEFKRKVGEGNANVGISSFLTDIKPWDWMRLHKEGGESIRGWGGMSQRLINFLV